jgi:tRNA-dihydrouridine synthase A
MKDAECVAQCMRALRENTDVPVTVKCRLGVDEYNTYEFLHKFVDAVSTDTGVRHFIIHARKALLNGLSPHQNRYGGERV